MMETDEQRRRNGGFAPYECKQCFRMNCGSHSDICDLCKDKNRQEEEKLNNVRLKSLSGLNPYNQK